jgi:hypothetical protein
MNIGFQEGYHPSSQHWQKTGLKFLDKLWQPPYHETEAIYLSSQSLQWINDKKT